jgi:hypothetical protein
MGVVFRDKDTECGLISTGSGLEAISVFKTRRTDRINGQRGVGPLPDYRLARPLYEPPRQEERHDVGLPSNLDNCGKIATNLCRGVRNTEVTTPTCMDRFCAAAPAAHVGSNTLGLCRRSTGPPARQLSCCCDVLWPNFDHSDVLGSFQPR